MAKKKNNTLTTYTLERNVENPTTWDLYCVVGDSKTLCTNFEIGEEELKNLLGYLSNGGTLKVPETLYARRVWVTDTVQVGRGKPQECRATEGDRFVLVGNKTITTMYGLHDRKTGNTHFLYGEGWSDAIRAAEQCIEERINVPSPPAKDTQKKPPRKRAKV